MKKIIWLLIGSFGIIGITFSGCRKHDSSLIPINTDVEQKFFSVPSMTVPEVKPVINSISKQNSEKGFVGHLVRRVGYPRWDKAVIVGAPASNLAKTSAAGYALYIPFSKDSVPVVNSCLIVRVNGQDTSYKMLYANQYRMFGFEEKPKTNWNARDIFNIFALLNYQVYGHTKFLIKDTLLYKPVTPKNKVVLTMVPQSITRGITNARMYAEYVCISYTYCQYTGVVKLAEDSPCYGWKTETRCSWVWMYADDGTGGSTGTDPGSTDPGTGGGGSGGGGSWSDDPCAGSTPSVQRTMNVVPCDEPIGWEPIVDGEYPNSQGFYPSRIAELKNFLKQNPFGLVPCNYLNQFVSIGTFQAPTIVTDRINQLNQTFINNNAWNTFIQDPFYIQDISDASSEVVNCDYFPIHIKTLPTVNGVQLTPEGLFDYFRRNWNMFIDNSIATFSPYRDPNLFDDTQLWLSNNPLTAMLHLQMINKGTVMVSEFNSSPNSVRMLVKTMRSPLDINHPVSGNRTWGIFPDSYNGGYLFYTSGVDRINGLAETVANTWLERLGFESGFDKADKLWRSLQDKMIQWINDPAQGGVAEKYNSPSPEIIWRPNWSDLEEYFQKKIDLNELRRRLGC